MRFRIRLTPIYTDAEEWLGGYFIIAICMINSVFRKKNYFA